MFILMIGFLIGQANASDDWLCKEAITVKRGDSIYVCGVAKGYDESAAKYFAFLQAKDEFQQICNLSADCKNHPVSLEAKRIECVDLPVKTHHASEKVECHRLIVFTIE